MIFVCDSAYVGGLLLAEDAGDHFVFNEVLAAGSA